MTEQQFSPLAERYMDTVFRVAYSYLRSPADADDVTQDVLLQLYKTDKAFDDESQKDQNTKYDNHISETNGKWAWSIH